MSYLLQIETATTSCSVALSQNGNVLAFKEINARNIHAEVITVYIQGLITEAGLNYADIDAVAVSCGPGSYTGLRIGVSTAKGLCFALNKPLISVDTLAAMASGIAKKRNISPGTLLCPMIDARRMEVFTAVFDTAGDIIKPTAAEIIDENSFADLLSKNAILFFGDGAEKCKVALRHNQNACFQEDFINSAVDMTNISTDKFNNAEFVDVAYFEPFYLKDFIAGKKAGS
ncbi:tRNA threonylcarbamoyladenosine biosynthesis protein TsaB [Mucilaginibacter sp. PAMC 26640]|nr:tRNA threonylcarbamoyladenosine biosynthesis protein TsaB [Mucilaginibacter sp. PAMC 26640]